MIKRHSFTYLCLSLDLFLFRCFHLLLNFLSSMLSQSVSTTIKSLRPEQGARSFCQTISFTTPELTRAISLCYDLVAATAATPRSALMQPGRQVPVLDLANACEISSLILVFLLLPFEHSNFAYKSSMSFLGL